MKDEMKRDLLRFPFIAAFCLVTAVQPAEGQTFRTLTISNGEVVVDGDTLSRQNMPSTLALGAVEGHFTFSGRFRPVLELDGFFYTLDDGRPALVEANLRDAGHVGVYLRTPRTSTPSGRELNVMLHAAFDGPPLAAPLAGVQQVDMPEVVVIRRHAAELQRQARVFQELSETLRPRLERHYIDQIDQNAIQLFQQAEQTAAVAEELPKMEVRAYLRSVERENRGLYDQLLRERGMELEANALAEVVAYAAEGPERDEQVRALHLKLREIFELKQENRRREIIQLEQRLDELRDRLQEREQLREAIIEQRIRTLVND
jgi:hypothetical protein